MFDVKEYYFIHTADTTINTETGMEIQSLGSPLALVPPPGAIMEIPPTLTQLTGNANPYAINDHMYWEVVCICTCDICRISWC